MLPRHNKILIIGSSPELRDMAFMTSKSVTCCDISKDKMEFMKQYMQYDRYIDNERLIECNPLQMSEDKTLSNEKFDLILSVDMHLNMLPFEEWNALLNQIANRLENNGYFILKVLNRPNDDFYLLNPTNADKIFEDWAYSKYRNDVGCLFVNLLHYFYYAQQNYDDGIHWKEIMDFVRRRSEKWEWKSDKQRDDFFEKFGCFEGENDRIFYCREEEDIMRILSEKLFYFQQFAYGDDDGVKYKYSPIYILGRQSSFIGGKPYIFGHGETKSELHARSNYT